MKFAINKNDVEYGPQLQKLIEHKIEQLDKILTHFEPDLVFLRITLNKLEKRKKYQASLVLEVPNRILTAEKQAPDLTGATNEAFEALFRETNQFKEKLRREPEFRRKRPSFKEMAATAEIGEEIEEVLMNFIEKNEDRFYKFALREIRNRIYQGVIRPGDIQVQEVLDEALLLLTQSLPEQFDERWVIRNYIRKINAVIRRMVREKRMRAIPIEKKVELGDIDTELYEYYQPDNLLRIEDLIPDSATVSEAEYTEEELLQYVDRVLSLLPNRWRQAFTLLDVEDFSPEEVAMIQDTTPEVVMKEAEMARNFIREKLVELGFEWKG